MGASAIAYAKFMATLPQTRALSDIQMQLNAVNQQRFPELVRALDSGEALDIDLGCGDGYFDVRLADRTNRWVIGIDKSPGYMTDSGAYKPLEEYKRSPRFLYLPHSYYLMTQDWNPLFSWLGGRAERTFMMMPDPDRRHYEEVELWLQLAAPKGELFVKTERERILHDVESLISRPYELLTFPEEFDDLTSYTLRFFLSEGDRIFSSGFRLQGK